MIKEIKSRSSYRKRLRKPQQHLLTLVFVQETSAQVSHFEYFFLKNEIFIFFVSVKHA